MVKLVFGKKATDESPVERPQPPARKPSMKISFKPQTPATEQAPVLESPSTAPKPKKQPKAKAKSGDGDEDELHGPSTVTVLKLGKRTRDDAPDGELPAKRQVKPTERAGSITFRLPNKPAKAPTLKLNTKMPVGPSGMKLKFGSGSTPATAQSATTPVIKIKARGKVPKRDPGVGYDSEDEDAEVDPVLENHFILRMQPGEDCDYLRAAIAESAIKHKPDGSRALGPDVWFKFFDKEGRHGVVCVRGHLYAASLLDLPCIVEAMKSWDKKGWYKTTDICQILLVLGRIEKEEQGKDYPLPGEVDKENWQYPHGLTPPMQWVRKRRFRKRINRRHIERVEADVDEVVKRDQAWEDGAIDSNITLEYEDWQVPQDESEMDAEGEEDDYEIEYQDEDGNIYTQEPDAMDQEAGEDNPNLETDLMAAFEDEEEAEVELGTTVIGDSSMLQASPDTLGPLETAVTPASGVTMSVTEDDDDDDEDDDDEDDAAEDEDDEERARRQEREQIEAEIDVLKTEIATAEASYAKQTNPLLKNKAKGHLDKLRADLQVKQSGLGISEED